MADANDTPTNNNNDPANDAQEVTTAPAPAEEAPAKVPTSDEEKTVAKSNSRATRRAEKNDAVADAEEDAAIANLEAARDTAQKNHETQLAEQPAPATETAPAQ